MWLVSDRRLSSAGHLPIDNGIKATAIETVDGAAIIGYSGIGLTAMGSQPSHWVTQVLRGRNCTLEQSLQFLADAMFREFQPHLAKLDKAEFRKHRFLAPAFVNGEKRLYTFGVAPQGDTMRPYLERQIIGGGLTRLRIPYPIAVTGSGAKALRPYFFNFQRPLLSLVRDFDKMKVSSEAVSAFLADLSFKSHLNTRDESVGPNSLVVWRTAKHSRYSGGGGHAFYFGKQSGNGPIVPGVAHGLDIAEIGRLAWNLHWPQFKQQQEAKRLNEPIPEFRLRGEELTELISKLPTEPDEKLK